MKYDTWYGLVIQVWATIDCKFKMMMMFAPVGEEPIVLAETAYGPRVSLISVLKVRDLLCDGCIGFLASLVDITSDVPFSLGKTRLGCEFLDLFSSKLARIATITRDRVTIELAPGTESVSEAPYRMAPAELKELKIQLQELLDLGFIRLSFCLRVL